MNDHKYEKFCKTNPPIGSLMEKHPEFMRAAIHKVGDDYVMSFMGKFQKAPNGIKIILWTGEIVNA